ncbi:MAG TPA: hypothetical protein VM734_31130, partial [Kofleriaceae bacterium]|nr:hypothetical protein [Kofleriaceae bacterium]
MDQGSQEGAPVWGRLWAPTRGLDEHDAAAVDAERVTVNVARVRAVAPFVALIMAAAGLVTLLVPNANPTAERWLRWVMAIDLTAAAAALAMAIIARSRRAGAIGFLRRHLGEVFAVVAIGVGAALAANTAQ